VPPFRLLSKTMVSPFCAAAISARSEPAPLSSLFVTVRVLGSQRSSSASSCGRKDRYFRRMESLRVRGTGRQIGRSPGRLAGRSGADHADGAVVQGQGTEVVEVGPERGDIVTHVAVLDGQGPVHVVEEAAACGSGGVAGQGASLEGGRVEVVDG